MSEALYGASTLTIGEGRGPAMINFVISNNRVRFAIDDDSAVKNGLLISSKLLTLAQSVKPRQLKESAK